MDFCLELVVTLRNPGLYRLYFNLEHIQTHYQYFSTLGKGIFLSKQ